MKKFFTAALLMVMGFGAMSAQGLGSAYTPTLLEDYDVYYSVRLGYNVASLRMTPDKMSSSAISGFNVGLMMGFPLNNSAVAFETGILLTAKGGKTKDCGDMIGGKSGFKNEVHMYGFEVPLIFKYNIDVPSVDALSVQPLFGGFINLGHNGKIKSRCGNERNKFKTYSGRFKRLDAGLRMGCGATFDFFYMEAVYSLGLVNLARDTKAFHDIFPYYDDFEDTAKTGCFSINFGVNF